MTKSVVSTLIGIAVSEGIIRSLDDPLAELLPAHRRSMTPVVAELTLRQLMTMSAGFVVDPPQGPTDEIFASDGDLVAFLLSECHLPESVGDFEYSNVSSHLVAAVLAYALRRADGAAPRSVLDYAREKLFDPLEITTRPAFTKPVPDDTAGFDQARFGWSTDSRGISMGAFGLRLTAPDLVKLGELYLNDGMWHDRRILPAEWVRQAMTPSEAEPAYGLMWWLLDWNGHPIYAARGHEGHLVTVAPDQGVVTAISSANHQRFLVDEEALSSLVMHLILPTIDES